MGSQRFISVDTCSEGFIQLSNWDLVVKNIFHRQKVSTNFVALENVVLFRRGETMSSHFQRVLLQYPIFVLLIKLNLEKTNTDSKEVFHSTHERTRQCMLTDEYLISRSTKMKPRKKTIQGNRMTTNRF